LIPPRTKARSLDAVTETDWRRERSRNGGADEIPLPVERGGLWLCGKHFIGPDVEDALRKTGATTVVCLNEARELEDRYPEYVAWLRSGDDRAIWHPVPDLHAPGLDEAMSLVFRLRERIDAGETLLVHCGAGIGRAGTVAVCVLMQHGQSRDDALAHVADHRPMAGPEVGAQRELVDELAAALR
jgi:protein-tyrosine phosphatase